MSRGGGRHCTSVPDTRSSSKYLPGIDNLRTLSDSATTATTESDALRQFSNPWLRRSPVLSIFLLLYSVSAKLDLQASRFAINSSSAFGRQFRERWACDTDWARSLPFLVKEFLPAKWKVGDLEFGGSKCQKKGPKVGIQKMVCERIWIEWTQHILGWNLMSEGRRQRVVPCAATTALPRSCFFPPTLIREPEYVCNSIRMRDVIRRPHRTVCSSRYVAGVVTAHEPVDNDGLEPQIFAQKTSWVHLMQNFT